MGFHLVSKGSLQCSNRFSIAKVMSVCVRVKRYMRLSTVEQYALLSEKSSGSERGELKLGTFIGVLIGLSCVT